MLFNKTVRNICPKCIEEDDELVGIIRSYLNEHKSATITDVVRDTEIPLEVILEFIEEKFIVLVDHPNLKLECSRCGAATQDGVMCKNCKQELVHELAQATKLVRNVKSTGRNEPQVVFRAGDKKTGLR